MMFLAMMFLQLLQMPDWNPLWGLGIAFACVLMLLALLTLIANRLKDIQRGQESATLAVTDAATSAQEAATAATAAAELVRREAAVSTHAVTEAVTGAASSTAEIIAQLRRDLSQREGTLAEIKHLVNSSATDMKERVEQLTAQLVRAGQIPDAPPKEDH